MHYVHVLLTLLGLTSCSALSRGGPAHRLVHAETGAVVELGALADELARADVVFLGELHTNDTVHTLEARTLEALIERRPQVVLTIEMFERDVQAVVDDYLAGRIDEEAFLDGARPPKSYASDYRPLIELAREHGVPVVAANIPREVAARIAKEGLDAAQGDPHMPGKVHLDTPEYRERFAEAMEDHLGVEQLEFYFAAQAVKDDCMAESIAAVFQEAREAGRPAPLVVHVCGRFHSDYGLGTVERLKLLAPELDVISVTSIGTRRRNRPLTEEERDVADWVWLVAP